MILHNIVIAGAGIVGNSIAYYLTKNYPEHFSNQSTNATAQAFSITLIDPVGICPGASGKAGGFLAKSWRDGMMSEELHRVSFDLHDQLGKDLVGTDYRRLDCAAVAVDGYLSRRHRSKKTTDKLTEWVDHGVVIDTMPMGTKDDIAQVHPKKLCDKMWEFSQSHDRVKLQIGQVVKATMTAPDVCNEADNVCSDTSEEPSVKKVHLNDGTTIDADILIVAMGPWTEEIKTWFPETPEIQKGLGKMPPVIGVKSHSMLVKTEKVLNEAVFFESDNKEISDIEVYPRPDGDSYITGESHDFLHMTERPGEEVVEPDKVQKLMDAMIKISSDVLGGLKPHTTQACFWPETPQGYPIVGFMPHVKGLLVATGHSVWGILQGPATGLAIAELLVEGESRSVDLSKLGFDRV